MKIKWVQVTVMALGMLILNGCFNTEAPKCSDEKIEKMVKEIYADHVKTLSTENILAQLLLVTVPKKIVKLDAARPVSYDEKITLRSCKANATFETNITVPVEYTVQLDEKNKEQIYVELKLDFLEDLAQQGMMDQFMKNMK